MGVSYPLLLLFISTMASLATSSSNGQCQLLEECSSDDDCGFGLHCHSCVDEFIGSRCVRSTASKVFDLVGSSLPFNKYAFLATHNSFAIKGVSSRTGFPHLTFFNQEDSILEQLNNGVRALMLDVYEYEGDIWLCHSFNGQCHGITAFVPLMDTLEEIQTFLASNNEDIVTLILEDHVDTPNALMGAFEKSGLSRYWFPLSAMPRNGEDWPTVGDMITENRRLVVFTSKRWKEEEEGIAYQWNFMVENQYGDQGMKDSCFNRNDSAPLDDTTKSLVLVNYFRTMPLSFAMPSTAADGSSESAKLQSSISFGGYLKIDLEMDIPNIEVDPKILDIFGKSSCKDNSRPLVDMLLTCRGAAGNRWANFVAVDYYKRSGGGGVFQAIDMLNGKHVCGLDDIHACKKMARRGDPFTGMKDTLGEISSWWTRFKGETIGSKEL